MAGVIVKRVKMKYTAVLVTTLRVILKANAEVQKHCFLG